MTLWWLFCFCNKPKERCDAEAQTFDCNEEQKEVLIQQPKKRPDIVITIGSMPQILIVDIIVVVF